MKVLVCFKGYKIFFKNFLKFKNHLYLDDNNNKTTTTTILNNLPHKQKTAATISTSSLRASLYQAKKRMLPKCASSAASRLPNKNGNVEIVCFDFFN